MSKDKKYYEKLKFDAERDRTARRLHQTGPCKCDLDVLMNVGCCCPAFNAEIIRKELTTK